MRNGGARPPDLSVISSSKHDDELYTLDLLIGDRATHQQGCRLLIALTVMLIFRWR